VPHARAPDGTRLEGRCDFVSSLRAEHYRNPRETLPLAYRSLTVCCLNLTAALPRRDRGQRRQHGFSEREVATGQEQQPTRLLPGGRG
jgi:hypothetical protein